MIHDKRITIILVSLATLTLFVLAFFSNQILPEFQDMFNKFDAKLPLSTTLIISTYKGWWLLPIITLLLLVDISRRTTPLTSRYIKNTKRISIFGILFAIALGMFSIYAMYAPVFQNAG